ncbi:MAG: hypothetical protein OEX81_00595 [Candidatus Pacebacteria bacterium]|nr:hypothetical protein [Candidatus Paceibacterota bacterium]
MARRSTLAERSGSEKVMAPTRVKEELGRGSMYRVQRKGHQGNGYPDTTQWKGAPDSYGKETPDAREQAYATLESRKRPIPKAAVMDFEQREGLSPTRIAKLIQENRIIFRGGKLEEVR